MKQTIILLNLFFSALLSAQTAEWAVYTPPPVVTCLAAKDNYALLGTAGAGIIQMETDFDRTFFHTGNSGLPNDTIQEIAISEAGDWWIYYSNHVARFEGNTWQIWTLTDLGFPSNVVVRNLKAGPDNSIYLATNNGVGVYKNGVWELLNTDNSGLQSNNLYDVAYGPDGKIYYGTAGGGVTIQDGANWTSYKSADTGIAGMDNVYGVAVTPAGTLWLIAGTSPVAALRIAKFEGNVWTGYTSLQIGIDPAGFFTKISGDSAGRIVAASSRTISILENEQWVHYLNTDQGCGLTSSATSTPAFTEDGQIWVQNSCQFMVFNGTAWRKPGTGLPGPAEGTLHEGIAEDAAGNIWVGTEFGRYISRFDGTNWQQFYPTDLGATTNDVYVVQSKQGSAVWFGLDNAELLKWENDTWTFYDTCKIMFPDYFTRSAGTAPNGDQWFSFTSTMFPGSTLARLTPAGEWRFFTPADVQELNFSDVVKIAFDANGKAWFATIFNGVITFDGAAWANYNELNSGLPDDRVFDLAFAPNGDLWVTADNGLGRFDGQTWETINTANSGLPSDLTRRIAFDKAGGMYVGYSNSVPGTTQPTVAVLRNNIWTNLIPPGWENRVNEQPDAFITDSKNRLWFAEFTRPGVYRYDPMLVSAKEPIVLAPDMTAAPNPCSDYCLLQFENPVASPNLRLHISNAVGQLVLKTAGTTWAEKIVRVDLSGLPAGVYQINAWDGARPAGKTIIFKQ